MVYALAVCMYVHVYMRVYQDAYKHRHAHACRRVRTCTRQEHTPFCVYAYIYRHAHAYIPYICVYMPLYVCIYTRICMGPYAYVHICMLCTHMHRIHTHTHTQWCVCMHMYPYARTVHALSGFTHTLSELTHTHTHTHTHTMRVSSVFFKKKASRTRRTRGFLRI
jgi:hypothetical protein